MKPSTRKLHEDLIRLCKGIVDAWGRWVKEREREDDLDNK